MSCRILSPLQAYDTAERQKRRLGQAFRERILRLHRVLASAKATPRIPSALPARLRPQWPAACAAFRASAGEGADPVAVLAAYRKTVMQLGLKKIDPRDKKTFGRDFREFFHNYVSNFPIPEEQESREGFRALWRCSPRQGGGYQEVAYSVVCPLTGRYIMGVNFTIQPRSHSAHFIYGFVNAAARVMGGFSVCLIDLIRTVAREAIAAHGVNHPEDRPLFNTNVDPLILFEKNIIIDMSLPDILMDTAGIDLARPPRRGRRLTASAVSQSIRDLVWDRRGARIIDYNYMQSSLDGVVCVPPASQATVIDLLNQVPQDGVTRRHAEQALAAGLGAMMPGCTTLSLCAFAPPGVQAVPAAQIRRANEIFQGISVVKCQSRVAGDIYFRAQMASLDARATDGMITLRPIAPAGEGVHDFAAAEALTRRLLACLTWEEIRDHRERSYGAWLRVKATQLPSLP